MSGLSHQVKIWLRWMRSVLLTMLMTLLLMLPPAPTPLPLTDVLVNNTGLQSKDLEMVDVQTLIPDIEVELRYAGDNNICGEPIYKSQTAYLRRGTANKLKLAQEEFKRCGYRLKIWDAYRPPSAQFLLWQKHPDPRFLINPHTGYSFHSMGIALDVTLIDEHNNELAMPSGFDDFSAKADRDFQDIDINQANNAELLEMVMKENGFDSIFYEWWHFVDHDRAYYDVIDPTS